MVTVTERRAPGRRELTGFGMEGSAATVLVSAPCRVDLGGGTLDIWPLGLLHPGARTLNMAITAKVEVRLTARAEGWRVLAEGGDTLFSSLDELMATESTRLLGLVAEEVGLPPAEIRLRSSSPRGAGLGASSALTVALLAGCERLLAMAPSPVPALVHLARDLEARLMSLPTGIQDHYPALLGGALEILHLPGGEQVRRLELDLEALARSLLVVHSGRSHFSAGNNFEIVRRRLRGEGRISELLAAISEVAAAMVAPLEQGQLAEVGRLMSREWGLRRQLSAVVSTPEIEEILQRGSAAGAWGGKACGAGGGGCVALLCPPERLADAASEIAAMGYEVLEVTPTAIGLVVEG